jgi:hypothetical protein
LSSSIARARDQPSHPVGQDVHERGHQPQRERDVEEDLAARGAVDAEAQDESEVGVDECHVGERVAAAQEVRGDERRPEVEHRRGPERLVDRDPERDEQRAVRGQEQQHEVGRPPPDPQPGRRERDDRGDHEHGGVRALAASRDQREDVGGRAGGEQDPGRAPEHPAGSVDRVAAVARGDGTPERITRGTHVARRDRPSAGELDVLTTTIQSARPRCRLCPRWGLALARAQPAVHDRRPQRSERAGGERGAVAGEILECGPKLSRRTRAPA